MNYQFTILVAMYEVEEYLPAFFESLDSQYYSIDNIEVIIVDDGSSDGSNAIANRWAKSKPNVTIYRQKNSGPGAARAVALEFATGDWVTVVDPDDILDPNYFSAVDDFIDRDEESIASLLSSRVYILNDSTGEFRDTHPLGKKFRYGDRLARLNEEPESFQLGATAFFRREVLKEHHLTYDPTISPTFEDAHLIGRYLATFDDPIIGLVSRAHYFYRKRFAQNSLVQSSWSKPDRFVNTPRHGYLDMLRKVSENGLTPIWAQYMVLYDLIWFFKEDNNMMSKTSWISDSIREEFLNIVDDIMRHIDQSTIAAFFCNPHPWALRESLRLYYANSPANRVALYRWSRDSLDRTHFTVLYSGPRPEIRIYSDGVATNPAEIDYTAHRFFNKIFMVEETFKLTGEEFSVYADGLVLSPTPFRNPKWLRPNVSGAPQLAPRCSVAVSKSKRRAHLIRRRLEVGALTTSRPVAAVVARKTLNSIKRYIDGKRNVRHRKYVARVKSYAGRQEISSRYKAAWIIMDRPLKADDNGEHFYRYVKHNHPEINSYFLLSRQSSDWSRLQSEGFRLIDYGSSESHAATLNAAFRISSDATADVMYPAPRADYGAPNSRFVFLQHGVMMNDLSRWLNPKAIDLIITTTLREYLSFVGETSYYKFRKSNVAMTGLARYDELARAATNSAPASILIMPTWRVDLRDSLVKLGLGSRADSFESSDYGVKWMSLIRSESLRSLANDHHLNVRLMLHPSLDRLLPELSLPEHVERVSTDKMSFQDILTDSRVFLTDYSSLAFDAGYIDVPTVYYQFDQEEFFAGSHSSRQGEFDYATDGLGPVADDETGAIEYLADILSGGPLLSEFEDRVRRTFHWRDQFNCERILSAIIGL